MLFRSLAQRQRETDLLRVDGQLAEDMFIHLKVCCPTPERLDRERVAGSVPFGKVELEVREGGMVAEGIQLPQLGEGSSIVVALVSLTVCVE